MKTGIFVAMAALALAVFGIPDSPSQAQGTSLDVRLSGGNFITSSEDGRPTPLDGRVITAMQSGIVKGGGGGIFSSQTVLEEVPANPADFPPDCLAMGLAGADLSATLVLIYKDGSLLSIATEPGSFYCTDGTFFTVEFEGIVTGGEGRFEGATGDWTGTAQSVSSRVTAELEINLN
jgi:hypothetical protein